MKGGRGTRAFDATPSSLARSRPGHGQVALIPEPPVPAAGQLHPRSAGRASLRCPTVQTLPAADTRLPPTSMFPPSPLSRLSVCPSVLCSLSGRGAALPGPRASQPLPPQASAFAGSLRPFAPPAVHASLAFSSGVTQPRGLSRPVCALCVLAPHPAPVTSPTCSVHSADHA